LIIIDIVGTIVGTGLVMIIASSFSDDPSSASLSIVIAHRQHIKSVKLVTNQVSSCL
jgi:uncharacterized membrane protein YgaE (UPF0421/DUF939 family)